MIDGATAAEAAAAGERIASILSRAPLDVGATQPLYVALTTGIAELAPGDDAAALVARAFTGMQPFGLRRASWSAPRKARPGTARRPVMPCTGRRWWTASSR